MFNARALAVLFLLALTLSPVVADDAHPVLVTAERGLSLRTGPSTTHKRIEMLRPMQPLDLLERKGDTWARVRTHEGSSGWVMAKYLSKTGFVSVRLDEINVRQGPSTAYPILMTLEKKFPLYVLGVGDDDWLKIVDYDGDTGWVSSNIVTADPVYVITTLDKSNVRAGAGTDQPIVFTTDRGYILKVLDDKEEWLNVEAEDGDRGWISANIVFGWNKPELKKED